MSRPSRRRALLIGNETYQDARLPRLGSVRADLELVAGVLADRRIGGFTEVQSLIDVTAAQFRTVVDEFVDAATEDELLVVYFSGHGDRAVTTDGEFHFLTTDSDVERLSDTAVRAGFVNQLLERCVAPQKVLIIDSCRSGGFAVGLRTADPMAKGAAPAAGRAVAAARGVYVVSSSRAGEASFAGASEREPSVFTGAFVEALRTGRAADGRTEITVAVLFEHVNNTLRRRDAGQVPVISASGVDGRIVLASTPLSPIQLEVSNRPPVSGAELSAVTAGPTAPNWPDLINYYTRCLRSEQLTWLEIDDPESYVCLSGRERLIVGDLDAGGGIAIPTEAAKFVDRTIMAGDTMWTGYPAVVVRPREGSRVGSATKYFAPLLIRRVEVVDTEHGRELVPVGPPLVNPVLLHEFLPGAKADGFADSYVPTWHAGEHGRLAQEARNLLRDELGVVSVDELEPDCLDPSLVVATGAAGARNVAVLFAMPIDGGPNKKLLADLAQIRDSPDTIAAAALSALAPDRRSVIASVGVADLDLVTPLPANPAQEAVIRSAMARPLTVATGPPGTGKSQLVVNLIATALCNGDTVLVASTNNRAVDEVWSRCEKLFPGMVIRSGHRGRIQDQADGLAAIARLSPAQVGIPTRAVEARYRTGELNRHRSQLADVAELEWQLLAVARRREAAGAVLSLDPVAVAALFAKTEWAAVLRRARSVGRFSWLRPWRSRRLLRKLELDDAPVGAVERCAALAELAAAERDRVDLLRREATRLADTELMRGLTEASGAVEQASYAYLDATLRTYAQQGRRQLTALLQHRTGSDWGAKRAALAGARAWALTAQSARAFPCTPALFDLVIVDEASQCSIPAALPLLYRAKRALIIGDPMQLPHIATLGTSGEATAARATGMRAAWLEERGLSYLAHSAFHAAEKVCGTSMLLDEHYRCHPAIADVANNLFYQGKLAVLTDVRGRPGINDSALRWHDVAGSADRGSRGSWVNVAEVRAVTDLVQRLRESLPAKASIGVVTPFRAQAERIKDRLGDCADVVVGTVHTFQGGECDAIVFSLVAAPDMPLRAITWLERQPNLWNVAITRARSHLHVVGDRRIWGSRGLGAALLDAADSTVSGDARARPWLQDLHRVLSACSSDPIEFAVTLDGRYTDGVRRGRGVETVFRVDHGPARHPAEYPPGDHLRRALRDTELRSDPARGRQSQRVAAWRLHRWGSGDIRLADDLFG
ncbi:AAA domain-containing protein [Nocardia thailandica]|uniref:AAA domain-containing protein n=1 Tax=Nocardia thailandica TaxID=257275 RepID=A0ABW6PRG3_9NOCA